MRRRHHGQWLGVPRAVRGSARYCGVTRHQGKLARGFPQDKDATQRYVLSGAARLGANDWEIYVEPEPVVEEEEQPEE